MSGKIRTNVYLTEASREKLQDIRYTYRKTRKLKKDIAMSEIFNRVIERLSIEKIMVILNGK